MSEDPARFCCQNPDCPDHGQRGLGNLRVCCRYGPQQRRMLACRTCQKRFSFRKGTPLFDCRLSQDQVVSVLNHVAEGIGVRKTSRLVGANQDTVVRYSLLAGEHARQRHDALVALSPPDQGSPVR
jgi:transposase-like protein